MVILDGQAIKQLRQYLGLEKREMADIFQIPVERITEAELDIAAPYVYIYLTFMLPEYARKALGQLSYPYRKFRTFRNEHDLRILHSTRDTKEPVLFGEFDKDN